MGYTDTPLYVRRLDANTNGVYGTGSATGNILKIYPNTIDVNPFFELAGNGDCYLYTPNGAKLQFVDNTGSSFLSFNWVTPDTQISTFTNYNLALLPQGTGKVKFGTYTATPATDSTGYISILDAAGNARKLMVQA